MAATVPQKWIQNASPDDRTIDVAGHALKERLAAVQYFLPLAAYKSGKDVEYVHQLRVWSHRATAAVRLYEELLPRRRCLWLKKQLKRVRQAANDARECDVLIARLKEKRLGSSGERWLRTVQAEREEAQAAVVSVCERLSENERFSRRIVKLLERIRSRGTAKNDSATETFGDWARTRLRPTVEALFAAVPVDPGDIAALHRFRICGKKLRYEMELLAGAFPAEFQTRLYPAVEALQDRLGQINDLATAKAGLEKKAAAATDPKEVSAWQRLLDIEQSRLNRALEQFWWWCTPRMLSELRDGFNRILCVSPQPEKFDRRFPETC